MQKSNTKTQVFICEIPNYQNATLQQKPQLQHSWATLLLKHAYKVAFGFNLDDLQLTKLPTGKLTCQKHYFSIAHSAGLVCVAVGETPVGVDIQKKTNADALHIARRLFTAAELAAFEHSNCPTDEFFLTWCKKEALWKSLDNQPKSIAPVETVGQQFTLQKFCHNGQTFFLAATGKANIQFAELHN